MSENSMNPDPPRSRYDLTQDGDRRNIDVGSADWNALLTEIHDAPIPLAKAAEIAEAAGVAAEHQAFLTDMSIKGLELLIKGAKKALAVVVLAISLAGCATPERYFAAYEDAGVTVVVVDDGDGVTQIVTHADQTNPPVHRVVVGPVSEMEELMLAHGVGR